jgi:hypothetical protein
VPPGADAFGINIPKAENFPRAFHYFRSETRRGEFGGNMSENHLALTE